jgi:glycosyltransferase involved in cell wall biosynthesis
MFADQHVESLGGAQVSMRLQRRYLERAGHIVTIVAPRMHRPTPADAAYIDVPSIPITPDREYALSWPGTRTDRFVDAALAKRPPVDVVHVQADFWGAFIGHRFAARHGLPVVHTMHNRVDVGIEATAPFPALVLRVLNAWARLALRPAIAGRAGESGHDGWAYLRRLALLSAAVTAPSAHFARRLETHGALPPCGTASAAAPSAVRSGPTPATGAGTTTAGGRVDVVWNGIDDDILDAALAAGSPERRPGRPRFVWIGRMSPEKRLLPFLEAVAASGIDADVEIIGGGAQLRAARRLVERTQPVASLRFSGRMPYARTLARLAEADAVVQTSIGFETQGMTVFEAASLGTPAVVSDPDIATELGAGVWSVADATIPALAGTLRRAASDIDAGSPVVVDPTIGERFRQSSRTAAMVEIYARAAASR